MQKNGLGSEGYLANNKDRRTGGSILVSEGLWLSLGLEKREKMCIKLLIHRFAKDISTVFFLSVPLHKKNNNNSSASAESISV